MDLPPSPAESGFGVQPEWDSCSVLHLRPPGLQRPRLWALRPMSGLHGKARTQPSAPTLAVTRPPRTKDTQGSSVPLGESLKQTKAGASTASLFPFRYTIFHTEHPSVLSDRPARLLGRAPTAQAFNVRFTDAGNTRGASSNFADTPTCATNWDARAVCASTLAVRSALSCGSRSGGKQAGLPARSPGGLSWNREPRLEKEPLGHRALGGEGPLAPGLGAPSSRSEAAPSTDMGTPHICTAFCADFHATCNDPRIFLTKRRGRTYHTCVRIPTPRLQASAASSRRVCKGGGTGGCSRTGTHGKRHLQTGESGGRRRS